MSTKNLWGELPSPDALRTPLTVLREQANLLTELTKGVLRGVIETSSFQGALTITLFIEAPGLNRYRHLVVRAEHGESLYPVAVDRGESVDYYEDEEAFVARLGEILSSPEVHRIIQVLLAQSTSSAA